MASLKQSYFVTIVGAKRKPSIQLCHQKAETRNVHSFRQINRIEAK